MKVLRLSPCVVALFCCLVLTVSPALCENMGSAFTYQGKLADSAGQPVRDGHCEVQFKLFDDATPGLPENQIGATLSKTVTTTAGIFTTDLDFGVSAFNTGQARWLEIAIGSSTLAPRIRVTPTPYSMFSAAPWGTVTGGIGYSGGNVAIGGSNPASKLDVTGTVRMTGFQLGTSTTAGNVLTANASGVGTWQPVLAMPPSGAAGGDLTGTYPNPTIAANAVANTELASDAASMAKVSGGVMTSTGHGISIDSTSPTESALQVQGTFYGVDQSQPALGYIYASDIIWQSFTAGKSGLMTGFSVYLSSSGWRGNATLGIYAGEGTGGTLLTSQLVARPGPGWQMFNLATPVSIVAGNMYTFGFHVPMGDGTVMLMVSNTDPYASGLSNQGPQYDYSFMTYMRTAVPVLQVQAATCNVGINTSNPASTLDVAGTVKMTGFRLGTSATSGQMLTTDASGSGTWQTLAGSLPPSGAAGGDLTGTYPNPSIATGAVTSAKIMDGTIAAADLGTSSVDTNKILDGTIAAADLGGSSVTNAKLADGAVTSTKILDGTIAAVDLGANSVDTNKILDGTIATADLGSTSVTNAKLADGAVTSAKILDGTIAAADLGASSVDATKLADGAVTQAKIAPNLSVDQVDGKHASDLALSSQFGVIASTLVTSNATLVTFSGTGGSGYIRTTGAHDNALYLICTAGVLEWRICYGSTISGGTVIFDPGYTWHSINYPHDTPFQIKIFRNDTHVIVDLWENDGNISGLYRKNQ